MSQVAHRPGGRDWLRDALPKLVLSPSFAIVLIFVYGFILFTFLLSFTDSKILPSFGWVGWQNYQRLFGLRVVRRIVRDRIVGAAEKTFQRRQHLAAGDQGCIKTVRGQKAPLVRHRP